MPGAFGSSSFRAWRFGGSTDCTGFLFGVSVPEGPGCFGEGTGFWSFGEFADSVFLESWGFRVRLGEV